MPVNPLLKRRQFPDLVQIELAWLCHRAFDRDTPWRGPQRLGVFGRLLFTRAELIVVVVTGDIFERRLRLSSAERTLRDRAERTRRTRDAGQSRHAGEESTPVHVGVPGRDFGRTDFGC